jgi:hypothetical protein
MPVQAEEPGKGYTVDLAYGGTWLSRPCAMEWRKSSYSNPSGNCVETARLPGERVAVRDSKRPGGPELIFSRAEWVSFLRALREP